MNYLEVQELTLINLLKLYRGIGKEPKQKEWMVNVRAECAYLLTKNLIFEVMVNRGILERDDEFNELVKRYEQMKEAIKIRNQARRHDARSEFSLTVDEWEEAKEAFGNKCAYCSKERQLTYDHFIPLSKGGSFTKENIIPACQSCNSSKCNKDFEDWYETKEFYEPGKQSAVYGFLMSR